MLTERRANILQFVVSEYIESATPVGSETVVRKYGIRVSPATIRNEMVRLEEAGYLMQPHTSAGRIPSDLGYRYYVESLMQEEELDEEMERTIRHQDSAATAPPTIAVRASSLRRGCPLPPPSS